MKTPLEEKTTKEIHAITLVRALQLVESATTKKYLEWRKRTREEQNIESLAAIDSLHSTVFTYLYAMLGRDLSETFKEILEESENEK